MMQLISKANLQLFQNLIMLAYVDLFLLTKMCRPVYLFNSHIFIFHFQKLYSFGFFNTF